MLITAATATLRERLAARIASTSAMAPLLRLLLLWFGLGLFFQNRGGRGDAVAFFEAEQADALGAAAGFADFAGVDADDFAVAGDNHHVGVFADLQSGDDGAVAVGGFQVDDAFAAAGGDAVFGERGALAVTFLGDGEHQRGERFAQLIAFQFVEILRAGFEFLLNDPEIDLHGVHGNDVVAFGEIHAVDAARCAAHGADFGFAEQNGLT